MTDPCTPPPGTKDGSWHWLRSTHSQLQLPWRWTESSWTVCDHKNGASPDFLARLGWRYIGPAKADTLTGIPEDWADCAQCGARRFYPSGQCMQYCDKKPSQTEPPLPWLALDLEAMQRGVEWLRYCAGAEGADSIALACHNVTLTAQLAEARELIGRQLKWSADTMWARDAAAFLDAKAALLAALNGGE